MLSDNKCEANVICNITSPGGYYPLDAALITYKNII